MPTVPVVRRTAQRAEGLRSGRAPIRCLFWVTKEDATEQNRYFKVTLGSGGEDLLGVQALAATDGVADGQGLIEGTHQEAISGRSD